MPAHFLFSLDDLVELGPASVSTELERASGLFVLDVPLPSIGNANSNVDVASDYADALFIGESLRPYCSSLVADERTVDRHYAQIRFSGECANPHEFIPLLFRLAEGLDPEGDDDVASAVQEERADLVAALPFANVTLPELADAYMGNEIVGQSSDNIGTDDAEEWSHFFPRQPEARLGFVRSSDNRLGGISFLSPNCWVIEKNADIEGLLRLRCGVAHPQLLDATLVEQTASMAIFTDGRVVLEVNLSAIREASRMLRECAYDPTPELCHYMAAWNGVVFLAFTSKWVIIVFAPFVHVIPAPNIVLLIERAQNALDLLRSSIGRPTKLRCDWATLDDEAFERLCCDVLAESGQLERSSVRKMGKSRSRDGGRDIEAQTRLQMGRLPKMWLYQCKLILPGSALSGSRVQVADVVDQYGADGFGVMTSGLVDATLWDKLKAINKNRGMDYDVWDQIRLENFLAEHREIKDRYFPPGHPAVSPF